MQFSFVRAEDLLSRPDDLLPQIVNWLGIRGDAEAIEAMKHPESSPFANEGPITARWANDPKFISSPRLHKTILPSETRLPVEIGPLAKPVAKLAETLGYRVDEIENPSPSNR
jgi:hypothetical protein